jgi:hypothetical protein
VKLLRVLCSSGGEDGRTTSRLPTTANVQIADNGRDDNVQIADYGRDDNIQYDREYYIQSTTTAGTTTSK